MKIEEYVELFFGSKFLKSSSTSVKILIRIVDVQKKILKLKHENFVFRSSLKPIFEKVLLDQSF